MDDILICIFTDRQRARSAEIQLVLQAKGIVSDIVATEQGYSLYISAEDHQESSTEITAYLQENHSAATTPHKAIDTAIYNPVPAIMGYLFVMCLVSVAAGFSWFDIDWYQQGRIDSWLVMQGQWWRLITALTLHANAQHLISNLGFGALFLYFTARYLGSGVVILAVLISAITGNAINVYFHGANHFSIGASTAVFATLGLLAFYTWQRRLYPQQRWSQRLGSIFGAIALLAFTGTSGERTDIGAHFWGFVVGGGAGWLLGRFYWVIARGLKTQIICATSALFMVILGWTLTIFS